MERWKLEQAEKAAKEKKEKEEAEKEVRSKMRERLLASGIPENQIQAILDGKRVAPPQGPPMPLVPLRGHGMPPPHPMHAHPPPPPPPPPPAPMVYGHGHQPMEMTAAKTTYTRMARKHLSIEALRARAVEFEIDAVSWPLHCTIMLCLSTPPRTGSIILLP